MSTIVLDFLKSLVAAYKTYRAERAAKDAAASQPYVDHADGAANTVAGEIARASLRN